MSTLVLPCINQHSLEADGIGDCGQCAHCIARYTIWDLTERNAELLAALQQQVALTHHGATDDHSDRCRYCQEFAYSTFEHHKANCEWRVAHERSHAVIAKVEEERLAYP